MQVAARDRPFQAVNEKKWKNEYLSMKPHILCAVGPKKLGFMVDMVDISIFLVGTIIHAVKLNQQWLPGTTSDPYDLPIGANGGHSSSDLPVCLI